MPYSEVSSIFRSAEEPQVKQNKNEHTRQNMKSKRSTLGALCKETKNQYMKDCAIMCHYSICFLLGLPVVARVQVSTLFFFQLHKFAKFAQYLPSQIRNQLRLLRNQYVLRILWPSCFFSTALPSVEWHFGSD